MKISKKWIILHFNFPRFFLTPPQNFHATKY